MARSLPPLNALRAFEAAARHGSFTNASNELCVTPGAVSRQVQVLEEYLGVPLFTRKNREVVISVQGQRYREALTAAFDQIHTSTFDLKSSNKLHISSFMTFCARWLAPMLPSFHQEYPQYSIMLTGSPASIFDVSSGTIDIAILTGRGDWPGVEAHLLFPVELEPVCSPAMLERNGGFPSPSDLSKSTLLHSLARPDDWSNWLGSVGATDVSTEEGVVFENSSLAFGAAAHGMGVAVGLRALVAQELARGELVRPFKHVLRDGSGLYLIYSQKLASDERVKRFRKWILREAAAYTDRYSLAD